MTVDQIKALIESRKAAREGAPTAVQAQQAPVNGGEEFPVVIVGVLTGRARVDGHTVPCTPDGDGTVRCGFVQLSGCAYRWDAAAKNGCGAEIAKASVDVSEEEANAVAESGTTRVLMRTMAYGVRRGTGGASFIEVRRDAQRELEPLPTAKPPAGFFKNQAEAAKTGKTVFVVDAGLNLARQTWSAAGILG